MKPRRLTADFPFVGAFDALRGDLPGAPLAWVQDARRDALARFQDEALPSRRVEAWKYTDLRALAATEFDVPAATVSEPLRTRAAAIGADSAPRLVIANGRVDPALSRLDSLPAGAGLLPMSAALDRHGDLLKEHLAHALDGDGLAALNAAFMMDGYVLVVDAGVRVDPVIEIVFVNDAEKPAALHPRNVVVMGEGAHAVVAETHFGDGVYWSNPVTDIALAQGASLHHYKTQTESAAAFHLAQARIALAGGARYQGFLATTGARLSRHTVRARIDGAGAACHLAGAYLVGAGQHCDIATDIDHAAGGSASRQVFKGVLDGDGHGVFQGKVAVARDAQKTDAHQLNNALLLSDAAEIDAKPELEIYADDVKCSHGATAGDLDENELFYLQARGIGAAEARCLLVSAFVKAALEEIPEDHGGRFEPLVDGWLEAPHG
jgi:Fe-S cluster assembly protein SufD